MTPLHEIPVVDRMPRQPRRWVPVVVLFVLVAGGAAGTRASFSAATSNPSTFATGVLVLSNDVNEAGACFSTGVGTITDLNAYDCDQLFDVDARSPGDTATANVDLRNEGNLDGLFSLHSSGCTNGNAATTHRGQGNPCGAVEVTVMEFADAATRDALDATGGECHYGGSLGAGSLCTFDAAATLDDLALDHPDLAGALDLGTLTAADTRYFQVGVRLPTGSGNAFQGRSAAFDITWAVEQT